MADKKITQLSGANTPLTGTELVELVQSATNVKATAQDIADLVDLTTIQSDIATLQSDVSNNTTDISTLQSQVTTNTTDISTLQSDVSTAQSDIAALQAGKQDNITLTTSGTSGAATFVSNTLNIPDYSAGSGGGISHTTASGTDTYTASVTGVTSYADGDAYLVRFTNGNTTGATLNINSLGAIALYRNNDGALIGGDIWDGAEMLCIYNSTLTAFQCIGTSSNSLFAYVTNDEASSITKGQVVYASGGTGDRMKVKLALNTADATSARTIGVVLSTSISAGQKGIIIIEGLLDGLSILPTATYSDGDPIYLGATAGAITKTKPYAPNHLVYVATVTTASNGSAGRMYVKVQNGYELDELHNVQAQSPSLKDTLWYDNAVSPAQWKTASIVTILGYTPEATITGAATTITSSNLTASRAVISNASGKVAVSTVTDTELGYVSGVTSAIQTQLDAKQPLTPRVQSVTSAATVTATASDDIVVITAQAATLTLANPTGAWVQGQALMIRIKDDGTARTINYGTNYRAIGLTLPTSTVASKTIYLGVVYNSTDTKWDVIGFNQQA